MKKNKIISSITCLLALSACLHIHAGDESCHDVVNVQGGTEQDPCGPYSSNCGAPTIGKIVTPISGECETGHTCHGCTEDDRSGTIDHYYGDCEVIIIPLTAIPACWADWEDIPRKEVPYDYTAAEGTGGTCDCPQQS